MMTPMQKLAVVLLAIAIACFSTWKVDAWRYGKQLSDQAQAHQSDLTAISNAANAQARQSLEKQQVAEQVRTDLDAKATKEKTNDLAENERLRRAADDSARRLRIAGSCRADNGDVPGTTSPAGLGNAGTVELTSIAGRTVFDIRAEIIADQAALRAAQTYIRDVCQQP
jgi:prophage endopeptidase